MFGREYRCRLCGRKREVEYARHAGSPFVRDFCKICRPHARRAISARIEAERREREERERREEGYL